MQPFMHDCPYALDEEVHVKSVERLLIAFMARSMGSGKDLL
jgi:hypothetical protein